MEIKHKNRKLVIEKKIPEESWKVILRSRLINFAVSATINFLRKRKCNTVLVRLRQCIYLLNNWKIIPVQMDG